MQRPRTARGIRSVASRAMVSIATVSRALNKPESVSAEVRSRIQAAIRELGYIPQASARALATRRTRTLGAIIPTIDNAMFARGIEALQKYLMSTGYMLLLTTSGYDLDVELEQARNLISRGVDGLILRGDSHRKQLRDLLSSHGVPFVCAGVYLPDRAYPTIGVDNEAAAYRAMSYMIDLGHRKIGIVSALQRNNDRASARVRGFRKALTEHAILLPEEWVLEVQYNLDQAREAARRLIAMSRRPSGIVCGNDVIAYGVLLEAERNGLLVPRDLSVIGFDDLEWSRHLRPSLTTIQAPTDTTWQRSGEYLVRHLAGETGLKHQELDFSLVVRESTAAVARTGDLATADAKKGRA